MNAEGNQDTSTGVPVVTIDVPTATSSFALDINAAGVIVGRYLAAGRTHGFVRSAEGDFTTIDVPGAILTVAAGINDRGDIVGQFALPADPTHRHGFLLTDGAWTFFDPPNSTFTNALSINERGDIVGRFCTLVACPVPGTGVFHGFLLSDGVFATIDVPGSAETDAFSVNGNERIAGGFLVDHSQEQLFVRDDQGFTSMATPGGQPIALDKGGMNERGDIVGAYCDGLSPPCVISPTHTHAFLMTDRTFETIDIPGALATAAAGINARGDIVGGFSNNGRFFHGFLRAKDPSTGQ
jgi:uncharacterized membrane protein